MNRRPDWDNYQRGVNNLVDWRIKQMRLDRFYNKSHSLLDLGANHGDFGLKLSKEFSEVVALEPFVQAPDIMPNNMQWVAQGFKDFIEVNKKKFDVVFSFAMTIQVFEVDGLSFDQIAHGHYELVKRGGVMIYETQKVENRPHNQKHVLTMLKAFYNIFGKWVEVGKGRRDGKRKYFIFKK
jgi:hypothetical protein